ncbi:MAG: uroporphyrinogen-III synthase [Porticoccaceae bacterium]|nr:uroporphyrinogen-III synthase [Porticoccaceae bacterium]
MSEKPLLVVRPLRDSDAFLDLLDRAAVPYRHIPIMKIQPLIESQPEGQKIADLIDRLDQFDQAIFISANAAEIGLPMLAKRWPKMPASIEIFAVGQQTGQLLSDYGYDVCCPAQQPNSEGLLRELPQLQHLDGKSVVIFRGGEGRQILGSELTKRGAQIAYCDLYQRVIEPLKVAEAQAFIGKASCLVAHSGELLQALAITFERHIPLVVPSARIAQLAQQLGYQQIQVAENALPVSMFDAVIKLRGK